MTVDNVTKSQSHFYKVTYVRMSKVIFSFGHSEAVTQKSTL